MSALPEAVWEAHLLPLLTCKDAARLGRTCMALRVVVREHHRGDLGFVKVKELRAALTTFPRAREVVLRDSYYHKEWEHGEKEALLQWLREGGRGSYIVHVNVDGDLSSDLVHAAIRQGALPSLKDFQISLEQENPRATLTEGYLGGIRELCVTIYRADEARLAALGLVGQLPCLTRLDLDPLVDDIGLLQWPSFIPPSLKALSIKMGLQKCPGVESLLRALPGILGASGARLEFLEFTLPAAGFKHLGDVLVHVAQALRCCSPTLKGFLLLTHLNRSAFSLHASWDEDYESQVERRRVQWTDVLAGVSACRELQVLVLPRIEIEPLFPPGTAFARLTHLEISDHEREHPPDAGVMGLWELMASGGLPALAKLSVRLEAEWEDAEEVRNKVVPAFEAAAGTLTHLHLNTTRVHEFGGDEMEEWVELGVAVGKLRRLKDLALQLAADGRYYHAFAQGLAASGGERPLPLLWRLGVLSDVRTNADLLSSLILPSVRVFYSSYGYWEPRGALLTACALRQAGYKHAWAQSGPPENRHAFRAIAQCKLSQALYSSDSWSLALLSLRLWDGQGPWPAAWALSFLHHVQYMGT
jgi:hypothetical protein